VPTIGVALAIPEPWATQLQDYRTALGDETASRIPTHITLIPPTEVSEDALPQVEQQLADAAARTPSFEVHLRGTGTFRPVSPVVFVTLVKGISQCEQLAAAVRQGLLGVDLEFPYHPHVTVAHHLPDGALDRAFEELSGFECRFEAEGFQLFRHADRDGWRPTREFTLGGGG